MTLRNILDEGQFAPGSMLPKVQAAVDFASSKEGRTAMITLLRESQRRYPGKNRNQNPSLICSADILLYISCLILIYITATYSGYLPYSEIIAQKSSGDLARNFFCDEWTRVSGKSFLQSARPTFRYILTYILRKAFFRHALVHRFRNNYTTHLSANPIAQV